MLGGLTRGKTLHRNYIETTVTITVDTTVPRLWTLSYHGFGTGVTTALELM